MMRLAAIATLAALLAGCEHMPREVLVPVPVPCKVDMPKAPAWAAQNLTAGADIFDQVKALLAERRQRVAYQQQLEAAIAGCQP